jgi:hypothetical protein
LHCAQLTGTWVGRWELLTPVALLANCLHAGTMPAQSRLPACLTLARSHMSAFCLLGPALVQVLEP